MENHEDFSSSQLGLDPQLYPDLVRLGGLSSGMSTCAHAASLQVGVIYTDYRDGPGLYNSANIDSERGVISVSLGLDYRHFGVTIKAPTFMWARGITSALGDVVGVVDAWLKNASLVELSERFPFMTYTRLARAYEDGDPVATQWDELLNNKDLEGDHVLIRAAFSQSKLRSLFPYVSHKMLRLSSDSRVKGAAEVRIFQLGDDAYVVEHTRNESAHRELGSLEEAMKYASSLA